MINGARRNGQTIRDPAELGVIRRRKATGGRFRRATCHRAGLSRATGATLAPMDPDAALDLLKAILAGTVRLPGAACIGRHDLFDRTPGNGGHQHQHQEQIRRAEAARLCATCPAIPHCTSATVSTELKEPA